VQFFAFVSFFPQLVAGPIERASHLLPQFERERKFDRKLATNGMRLILWGLFKKMVIADRVAIIVEQLYAEPAGCDSIMALSAAILFAYQVYCDFSGYSDIAIGAGRLLGFELTRNFITPFLSTSMTPSCGNAGTFHLVHGFATTSIYRWVEVAVPLSDGQ
jgi:D-alanyl-lipoteichoic acid acyltransferase DltB (MBOAT superfamily)